MKASNKLDLIQDFEYKVIHSWRRTMSIIVSPDKGVVVKAPLRTPDKLIRRFLEEKSGWITRTLESFNSLERIDDLNYSNGGKIMLEGKEYLLKVTQAGRHFARLIDGNAIEVGTTSPDDKRLVELILEAWFKLAAREKLTPRFGDILARYKAYDLKPTGFSVGRMKKRWGSCSSKGRIAISYDLIKIDPVYADYVIVHELCHLRHHNHSNDYYRFLTELYPEWKEVRNGLKKYIR